MSHLIALTGFAGSGKNEAAKALEGWQVVSFADPIRADLEELNPIVYPGYRLKDALKQYGGWELAKRSDCVGPELRNLMQRYGMLQRERYGENVWVNRALPQLMMAGNSVIVDLRFPNELAMVKRLGGVVVRITRPGVGPCNEHCSENQQLLADHEIINETVAGLHAAIREIAHWSHKGMQTA